MKSSAIVLSLFASAALFAQSKPADVVLQQVNDHRTAGSFSRLTISMELPKVPSSQVAASRVLVTSATDDTGANLIDPELKEPELESNMRGMGPMSEKNAPVSVSMNLKTPSRKATKVKEARGEIELFMPDKDPNSVAEVKKFMSFSGKTINHKALKANGVEIVMLSKAQIEAERKKIGDAKRKEYKDAGYEDGEDLENNVKSAMEYTLSVEANDVPVRIKDPNKSIQDLEYIDGKGEVKHVYTRSIYEDISAITMWGDPPGPDWTLRVKMRTPKNLMRQSFVLKDVALP
jgi:hypothetical protein